MKDYKKWFRAALIRSARTFAESMLAYIGTGALLLKDVNWLAALSAGAFGAVTALLLALAGLPEVTDDTPAELYIDDTAPVEIEHGGNDGEG